VEHFLKATAASFSLEQTGVLVGLALCEYILLRNFPDKASEMLLSILTSTRVNTEELAIRAYKLDRDRAKVLVKVLRDALEAEPGMRKRENVLQQNYFSHLFSSVAINAALQYFNPKA